MSFNLLDKAKGLITNELIIKAASFSDESESSTTKAFSAIIPSLFGAIAHKASTNEGANMVSNLAYAAYNSGFLNKTKSFFDNNNGGGLLNKGAGLLSCLFSDDKVNTFAKIIAGFSGIRTTSAHTLLSMVTPLVLGILGEHGAMNNLNAAGLSSLLSDKKNNIINALPGGLSLNSIFHGLESREYDASQKIIAKQGIQQKPEGALKWLLPLLLIVLFAMGSWYFTGKGSEGTSVADQIDSLRAAAEKNNGDIKETNINDIGKVDTATGDFIYAPGKMITINLPDGAGNLEVGENSTENKLYKFLMDRDGKLDSIKGNWFEFTNVHFKIAGIQLDSTSLVQLKNITAITKAFPTAEFKIGGYTDNSGDSSANIILSQKRAEIVVAALKNSGASPSAITGAKGYGPQWPLQDNVTPEGRAMNRRVAVNVKAK